MSETEEPPAKVLKIDNFEQELSIPDIEPIGNGSSIPDGLGDAASVVDGEIPERLQVGDEEADVAGADNDLNDAEDKESNQFIPDPDQGTKQTEPDISEVAAQLTDDILDQDNDNVDQELDNTDQEADKSGQDMENLDLNLENINQSEETLDQSEETLDQSEETLNHNVGKQNVETLDHNVETLDQNVETLDHNVETLDQNIETLDHNVETLDQNVGTLDHNEEKLDQDADKTDQDGETPDQDGEKPDQDGDKLNQDANKSDQDGDKPDPGGDKTDQDGDKPGQGLVTDQDASGSHEEVEGQEEWLSEGILTDDDLTANASTNQSEDDKPVHKLVQQESRIVEQNIEETLNHLDGSTSMEQDGGDDGTVDKSYNKNQIVKQATGTMKGEPDDGNDTDDLLRMLGEDDSKKAKKLTKTVKDLRNAIKNVIEGSDDEDFEYDETSIRKLKVTKNSITKKAPPKAVPEDLDDGDDDDSDESSDEALTTIKKSFSVKKTNLSKKLPPREQNLVVVKKASTNKRPPVNVVSRRDIVSEKPVEKKSSALLKLSTRSILKTSTPAKMVASKPNTDKTRIEFKPPTSIKTATPFRAGSLLKTMEIKHEEQEDEFLEDDDYAMNEDFDSDIDDDFKSHQRIMKPERMDEEVPSDGDSCDEDGSLYDELPSSESDDMDDWFHIDIRAERASDYIPLLGSQAKDLLTQEKKRSAVRVSNLRQSLSALTESGKKQAEELRKATMALAELDDLLKAS